MSESGNTSTRLVPLSLYVILLIQVIHYMIFLSYSYMHLRFSYD